MTRVGHPHPNGYSFRAYLLTECATSKTEHEPQGGENMSAELDEKYENAWHSVAKPPRRRSGIIREMPLSMRALSVVPRYAVAVGSLSKGNGDRENT